MRLYLIRHGETDYNRDRIVQGHSEQPINDAGIAQAHRLGMKMRDMPVDRIYASDLRRATMTACIIAAHCGAPLAYDPEMRERDPGELTHRSYEEAMAFFTDPDYLPPGGEGVEAFEARVLRGFAALADREGASNRRVAVVTHGMVCGAFLKTHCGLSPDDVGRLAWRNTCISTFDYNGKWSVVELADASHLDEPEAQGASATGA